MAACLVVGLVVGAGAAYAYFSTQPVVVLTTAPVETATVTSTITPVGASGNNPLPTIPATTSVTLDSKTTAVMVLDYVFCYRSPGCNATLPAIRNLLNSARAAGALVIYTKTPIPQEIANKTGDIVITNDVGPDKYYNTSLYAILHSRGIRTLVIMGIASNGALLYTAQESCVQRFTVVVPADTVVGTAFVVSYVEYQLLNGPGCANPNNTALSPAHATLSTTSGTQFK